MTSNYKGRQRDEKVRLKILNAMIQLISDNKSIQSITMENIAKEASVSKATIYKWWKSKELLFVEAFHYYCDIHLPKISVTELFDQDFLERLVTRIISIRQFLMEPIGRTMMELSIINIENERLFREIYQIPRRKYLKTAILHLSNFNGKEKDVELFLDLCFSTIYYSAVVNKTETEEEIKEKIITIYRLLLADFIK